MKSFHATRLLLSFTCYLQVYIEYTSASATYHPSEPTATLSLVRDPEDPSNRYSLQVSTDQINHYLKTLSNVPSSIYDGAHIITDFDESAIANAYSRAPSPSGESKYTTYEESPRGGDKATLYQESHYGSESSVYPKKSSAVKVFDDVDFGSSRITANPRALRKIILGGREFIIRKDEPSASSSSPATAASTSSSSSPAGNKDTKLQEETTVVKASSPAIIISDSKPVAIEIGQKPASNEYPPSLPSNQVRATYGLPRETISKEKSEAELEREKDEQSAMEKVQDDLMKELYSIQKQSSHQSPQSNEAVRETDSNSVKDNNNNKNDVDLKTVQTLLTTLIKQIEQIQSVAKSLPVEQPSAPVEEPVQYVKEYIPTRPVYKEARQIEPMASPFEIRGKKIEMAEGGRGKKNKHHQQAQRAEEHQEIFLKAPDLVKLLTGESYDPSEFLPMPSASSVNRRFMPMAMPHLPLHQRGAFSPFPFPVSYPAFPFYPGFKK